MIFMKIISDQISKLKQKYGKMCEYSKELKEDVRKYGRNVFRREILSLHKTLGQVNYEETRQLFIHNVLTEANADGTPAYYNSNILGRYMKKDYFRG